MNDDPYHDGGSRGHSGTDTSREAAQADLVSGVTNATQKYVLIMADQAGERGVTVAELRESKGGLHHGRVSSAVTKQHIAGRLVRLVERRGHCHVYVTPEHLAERDVLPYRQQNPRLQVEEVADVLAAHGMQGHRVDDSRRVIFSCRCGWGQDISLAQQDRHVAELIVALSRGELS